ncbi:hypothetical protein [Nonomuraea salmonea]|uniref:hypothetical protein n=1 Tax=Nonomuraea salmonea TaxID=46181 RepID=UPI0031EDF7FF
MRMPWGVGAFDAARVHVRDGDQAAHLTGPAVAGETEDQQAGVGAVGGVRVAGERVRAARGGERPGAVR